jgi:hypothetical protein
METGTVTRRFATITWHFTIILLDFSQLSSAYRRQALNICVPLNTIAHIVYRCHCVWPPADQSQASGGFEVTAVATIAALHFGDGSSCRGGAPRPLRPRRPDLAATAPFRLPPPAVRRNSAGWIALGRNRLRGYQRVTDSVEASALRALPVGVLVRVIVPSVQFLLLQPRVDEMRSGLEVLVLLGRSL